MTSVYTSIDVSKLVSLEFDTEKDRNVSQVN